MFRSSRRVYSFWHSPFWYNFALAFEFINLNTRLNSSQEMSKTWFIISSFWVMSERIGHWGPGRLRPGREVHERLVVDRGVVQLQPPDLGAKTWQDLGEVVKCWRARSRLYRRRLLQVDIRFAAFFKL